MHFSRILCVDNNASLRTALKRGLGSYGFDVIAVSNGMEALMQYEDHSGDFGALITSNDLPQMDGLELAHAFRDMGFEGRIVVIFHHLKSESLRAYQEYAINGFFRKPFQVSLLATMLLQTETLNRK